MKASRDVYVEVAVLLAAIFAGLVPLASLSVHDQESPATGETPMLSLSDLEELARRSNPALVQAAAAVSGSGHIRSFINVSSRNGNTAAELTAAAIAQHTARTLPLCQILVLGLRHSRLRGNDGDPQF
jgi:hypothetical protein